MFTRLKQGSNSNPVYTHNAMTNFQLFDQEMPHYQTLQTNTLSMENCIKFRKKRPRNHEQPHDSRNTKLSGPQQIDCKTRKDTKYKTRT